MAEVSNSKLLQNIEGIHLLKDALVVLVKTEWNATIVDELERGCLHIFLEQGIRTKTLVVPGAVEIPFAINHYWNTAKKKTSLMLLLLSVVLFAEALLILITYANL